MTENNHKYEVGDYFRVIELVAHDEDNGIKIGDVYKVKSVDFDGGVRANIRLKDDPRFFAEFQIEPVDEGRCWSGTPELADSKEKGTWSGTPEVVEPGLMTDCTPSDFDTFDTMTFTYSGEGWTGLTTPMYYYGSRDGGGTWTSNTTTKPTIFNTYSLKRKGKFMKLNAMMKRLLDEDTKALVKAGYLDSNLELTDSGREAMTALVFEQQKAAMVKQAQEVIAEREACKK